MLLFFIKGKIHLLGREMIRRKTTARKNIKFNKGNRNKLCYCRRGLRGYLTCPTTLRELAMSRRTAVQKGEQTTQNRINDRVTTIIIHESHFCIYINSIIFTHIKCIVELFCADRRFSNQFPFISVYPYYHICVRTSIMGWYSAPPVSANFTQIVNNPPSS